MSGGTVADDLLEASSEIVWVLDEDGPITASAGARRLIGITDDRSLAELSLLDLLSPSSADQLVSEGLAGLSAGGVWTAMLDLLDRAGDAHRAMVVLRHHDGKPQTWSISATAPASRIEGSPLRDEDTGLPTEPVLHDRLELSINRAIRNGRRTCLVVFVIDGFDELVAAVGDDMAGQLVVAAATALSGDVRPGDTLARTAIDRFEVVRDDVSDIQDAERFAERLRVCLDEPVVVEGVRWYLSLSAGVALTQPGVTTVAGLRRNGQTALDQAVKLGGAHTVVFGRALREGARPATARATPARRAPHRRATRSNAVAEEPPNRPEP